MKCSGNHGLARKSKRQRTSSKSIIFTADNSPTPADKLRAVSASKDNSTETRTIKSLISSADKNIVLSADKNKVLCGDKNTVVSADKNIVLSAAKNIVLSTDKNIILSADHNIVLAADKKKLVSPDSILRQKLLCTVCEVVQPDTVGLTYHYLKHTLIELAQALTYLQVQLFSRSCDELVEKATGAKTENELIKTIKHEEEQRLEISKKLPPSREPHQCTVCNKLLASRSNLKKHMIIHGSSKPFSCTECEAVFNQARDLNAHKMQKHSLQRPHSCRVCGKGFVHKFYLEEHLTYHTGEKNFQCTKCGKRFSASSALTKHMKRHALVKLFKCDRCEKSFCVKEDLKAHLRLVHESGVKLHQPVSEIKPKNKVAHKSLAINSPATIHPDKYPCSTDNEKLEEVNANPSATHKPTSADDSTSEVNNEQIEVVGNHFTLHDSVSVKDLELVNDKSQSSTNTRTEEHNYTTLEKSPSSVDKQNTIDYNLSTIGYRHSGESKQTAFDDKSTLVHEPTELDDKATKIDDFVLTLDQNSTNKIDHVTINEFSTNDLTPDLVVKSTTVDNEPQ